MKNYWILLVFLSLVLIACEPSKQLELKQYFNRIKSKSMQIPEPINSLKRLEKFPFIEDQPSPFQKKCIKSLKNKIIFPKNSSEKTLDQYPLESLKFVGLLKNDSETWALISGSEGELFPLKKGDFLGKNHEKIIAIKENSLELEEKLVVAGEWKRKAKNIYLGK